MNWRRLNRFFFLLLVVGGPTAVAAILFSANRSDGATKPAVLYSIRHEPGARGHTLTTVAFPVRIEGYLYACVVTEDVGDGNGTGVVAVTQSCDFSVGR